MLTQDYADEKIEVLEGWLHSAGEIARKGKSTQEEAERLISAMTDEEAEAFWELYAESEDILLKIGRGQMDSSDVEIGYEALRGVAALVYARTIIDYDPERGDLAGYLMTASRPHWRSYLRSISRSNSSSHLRRIDKLLRQLRVRKQTMEGRDPTLEEQLSYVRDNNYWSRRQSDEKLISAIREVEQQEEPESLDSTIPHREGSTQTLQDVLPSPTQVQIDTEKVARIIASRTDREELLDALLGEEPEAASFDVDEAREIYLERESRGASSEQIAWEHQTSPFLVEQIEDIYDIAIPIQDVERYAEEQGYDYVEDTDDRRDATGRKLSDEQVREIYERYHEEDVTYSDLAEDYPVSPGTLGRVVTGESYQHVERPDVDEEKSSSHGKKLTGEQVRKICRRYAEEDVSYPELAEEYGVDSETIGRVVRGETYTDINR